MTLMPVIGARRFGGVLLSLGLGWVAACGGASHPDALVAFDAHRKLSAASSRSLAAVSGSVTVTPSGLDDADLMGSMTTPWKGFDNNDEHRAFDRELARARGAAAKYANAEAAARDDYVLTSYFVADFGVHWINWSLVTKPFDPARPAMLLYDGEGTNAHLVGLSYYLRRGGGLPPDGFSGDNDRWHRHFGACYAGGFIIGESVMNGDDCTKRCEARAEDAIHAPVGTAAEIPEMDRYLAAHPGSVTPRDFCALVPGDDVWMLHLWVSPGHANPNGKFSTLNPTITRCRGRCRSLT